MYAREMKIPNKIAIRKARDWNEKKWGEKEINYIHLLLLQLDQIINILQQFSNDLTAKKFMLRRSDEQKEKTQYKSHNISHRTCKKYSIKLFESICFAVVLLNSWMKICMYYNINECKHSNNNRLAIQTKCRKIAKVRDFITAKCSRLKQKAKTFSESTTHLNRQIGRPWKRTQFFASFSAYEIICSKYPFQ